MHPWSPYEGIIGSIRFDDVKRCQIFYVTKLSLQPDRAEWTLLILIKTLNNDGIGPKLRQVNP